MIIGTVVGTTIEALLKTVVPAAVVLPPTAVINYQVPGIGVLCIMKLFEERQL